MIPLPPGTRYADAPPSDDGRHGPRDEDGTDPLRRLSFNQATAKYWPVPDLVRGCVAAGVSAVGLWREPVAEYGLDRTAALVRDAGLSVTSLCRGGFFQEPGWYDENRRAIDEAAALGAPVLVLVCGGLPGGTSPGGGPTPSAGNGPVTGYGPAPSVGEAGPAVTAPSADRGPLDTARARVAEAIDRLVPHALAAGVRLAIEPLHPMFCSDRSVVATLGQALELAAPHPSAAVGVVVDTYHVWWDDQVWAQIARAGAEGRLACFQVADWITPLPEGVLLGRGLPGTGCVETRRFRRAVEAAGYHGPVEVEIFHADLWARPGHEILDAVVRSYRAHVA